MSGTTPRRSGSGGGALTKKRRLFSRALNTVHCYCSRVLLVTIQKLYCNTIYLLHYYLEIQFSNFLPLQYTLVYCNTISMLFASPLYCNTISSFSCNTITSHYTTKVAIQFCIATQPTLFLQYNSSYSSLLLYNTKIVLQYNFLYFKPSLQYNPAIQCLAYLLYCNTILTLQAL